MAVKLVAVTFCKTEELLIDNDVAVIVPPTYNPPPMPTPPTTCKAPEFVEFVAFVPVTTIVVAVMLSTEKFPFRLFDDEVVISFVAGL